MRVYVWRVECVRENVWESVCVNWECVCEGWECVLERANMEV